MIYIGVYSTVLHISLATKPQYSVSPFTVIRAASLSSYVSVILAHLTTGISLSLLHDQTAPAPSG